MAQDVEAVQEKPPNACCAELQYKNAKLLEKYKRLTEIKNQLRGCTDLIERKYNVIEKENESLKKALEELKLQANMWKDEKELEAGRRIDLEDEVSALEDEVRSLKQNGNSTSEEADKQLQERLVVAEEEIKQLNVLLVQERGRIALEKKKADEALKKAEKKADAEKQKGIRERTRADSAIAKSEEQRVIAEANMKKAAFQKGRADDLNQKLEEAWNKAEAAGKIVEEEMQRSIREEKNAEMAVAKSEEQQKLAETYLKMAMFEKDRANDLNTKLEEARNWAEKIEKEIQDLRSNAGNNAVLTNNACADSEERKDLQHKRMAMEQKARADHLSKVLESYKLKFEESQKEQHEFISCIIDNNVPLRNNDVPSETDTVKLLKTQLELERSLVIHAKNATKIEALRYKMLHQELCNLKQECCQFQQHLDIILDKSFLLGGEGIDQLEKIGNEVSITKILGSDGSHIQLTDSGMDPQYGGSNQKMLQSSAINSRSASFCVIPQERGTSSVMTSANLGKGISSCEPSIGRQNDNPKGISCRELSSPCKKRKTSSEGTVCQNSGLESILNSNTNGCMPASSPGPDPMIFKDGMNNITVLDYLDFDEMVGLDFVKLLELDNAADEDSYRGAVAMPLSPMLPVLEFLEEENSEMLFF